MKAMNRLALVGIILTAAGLVTLAFSDPVLRFLVYGGTAFTAATGGGTSAGTFVISNSTRSAAAFAGRATSGTGSNTFIETLVAFGVAVVGLVLTATALLIGGAKPGATAGPDHSAVS